MTITIDLPEDTAANLRERARAQARPAVELVTEAIIERFGNDYDPEGFPLDADAVEKIRRGFADMEAGRSVSLEDSRARVEGLLTARHML